MTEGAQAGDRPRVEEPPGSGQPSLWARLRHVHPRRVLAALWVRLRHIHPGLVLAGLDFVGLCIASYLSTVELQGELPYCGALHGCETVATSQYSRIAGVPVAVFGVFLSVTLLVLALAWWRSNDYRLLLFHYGLSLVGVLFEGWFQFAQVFLIGALCVWCETYGLSLVLRFVIALWVYLRTPNPNAPAASRSRS